MKEWSEWDRGLKERERGVHERTISAGVVWCGVCTVPATLCKGWGEPAPAPLKALWDYRPISLFHALLTILFPSSMLPTLFFPRFIEKYETRVEHVYLRNRSAMCIT